MHRGSLSIDRGINAIYRFIRFLLLYCNFLPTGSREEPKVLGIVSFVLSILGLVCFFIIVFVQISGLWFSFGCAAFSVTALVLGAVSRKKQKNHNAFALIQNIDILYFI